MSSASAGEVDIFAKRKVLLNNGVQYVIARRGDTFKSLSKELELGYWQLPKYNEMDGDSPLADGQMIYIQPKESKTSIEFYVVKEGDTVHSISQEIGIKSKFICKWNGLQEGGAVQAVQKLWLQKHKS